MSDETLPATIQPLPLTRTAAEILARAEAVRQGMAHCMKKDRDYGVIPGCGNKPSLLKPGAEKLAAAFMLAIDPVVEDMSGPDEVRYRVTARVTHSLTGALRGAIAVLLASPDAKPSTNLMPMVPWELPAKTK